LSNASIELSDAKISPTKPALRAKRRERGERRNQRKENELKNAEEQNESLLEKSNNQVSEVHPEARPPRSRSPNY